MEVAAVFTDDVVQSCEDERLMGIVEYVGGQSDDDDDEEREPLPPGKAAVTWYPLNKQPKTEDVESLRVIDRGFLHHDIVARKSNPFGENGYISNVKLICDVRCLHTGKVYKGIDSSKLRPVQPLRINTYVTHNNWVGKIENTADHLLLKFSNDSVCMLLNVEDDLLPPVDSVYSSDDTPYYPGLRVKTTPQVLRKAFWIKGKACNKHSEAVVLAVKPGKTDVLWISNPSLKDLYNLDCPPYSIDGNLLKVLDVLTNKEFMFGDIALCDFITEADEESVASEKAGSKNAPLTRKVKSAGRSFAINSRAQNVFSDKDLSRGDIDRCVEIIFTYTYTEVTWQSGTVEKGIPSLDLVPVFHLSSNIRFPNEFVIEKIDDDVSLLDSGALLLPNIMHNPSLPAENGTGASHPPALDASSSIFGFNVSVPEQLHTDMNQVRQLVMEKLSNFLPPEEWTRFQAVLDSGNVNDLMAIIANNHGISSIFRREMSSPQWQDLIQNEQMKECLLSALKSSEHDNSFLQNLKSRRRLGVVQSMDSADKVCKVKWIGYCSIDGLIETLGEAAIQEFNDSSSSSRSLPPLETTEISCYDIVQHPSYTYAVGDVVLRLRSKLTMDGSATNPEPQAVDDEDEWETTSEYSEEEEGVGEGEEEEGDEEGEEEGEEHGEGARDRHEAGAFEEMLGAAASTNKQQTDDNISWVGIAIAVEDGKILVAWSNGETSWMMPNAIFRMNDEHYDSESWSGSEAGSNLSQADVEYQETSQAAADVMSSVEQMNNFLGQTHQQEEGVDYDAQAWEGAAAQGEERNLGGSAEVEKPDAASKEKRKLTYAGDAISSLWRAIRKEIGTFFHSSSSKKQKTSQGFQASSREEEVVEEEEGLIAREEDVAAMNGLEAEQAECEQQVKEIDLNRLTREELDDAARRIEQEALRRVARDRRKYDEKEAENEEHETTEEAAIENQFEVVETLADHHFAPMPSSNLPQQFVKRVRHEWKLLSRSLPPGIHVKVSEERMDLLRAIIHGPTKTPYEDGLYAFDILLSPDYPTVPPSVFFFSFGDRLNPNLYTDGKVCLSLLGTWDGEGVEKWNAETSNVLQVLVSIQGLVLVPEPYYNEAGYDKQIGTLEGKHNSQEYNESALLLVLKHMLNMLRAPVPSFEGLIKSHFKERRDRILSRCEKLLNKGREERAKTASKEEEDPCTGWIDRSIPDNPSRGFMLTLQKLCTRLRAELPT